jgi:acyl carrier protein
MADTANNEADPAILAELAGLLALLLKRPDVILTAETTAADVDGWDSLIMLRFVFEIETHFGIAFKSSEIDRFTCVGDLVKAIRARRPASLPAARMAPRPRIG